MAFTVFESTNMKSTHFAERILDAKNIDADVENGTFGYLSVPSTDYDYDIKKFNVGVSADGDPIMVADNPEWTEEMIHSPYTRDRRRDKYTNKAGVPFRVRTLAKGDTFGITIDGFTPATQTVVTGATTVEGIYVSIDAATGKLIASTTAPAGTPQMVGVIQKSRVIGGTLLTAVRTYGYASTMYEIKVTELA